MSDAAAAGSSCAALCVICCTESLFSWCNYKACGSGSSGSTAGCCTSCCKRSFDDDEFEKEEEKLRKKRAQKNKRETNGDGSVMNSQPDGSPPMAVHNTAPTGPPEERG
ncbi:hypothetical protein BXZ70DRAFT_1009412 [Cristinia sonorae]|uniref:Uncharacterized protein n=1 Tax=Cristinia sonorae TaxID=1940300 RepID=A0A8K0UL56_9AGAR|nr:hypothetical protein BXZ70DRAFT_1009412 [Cristinia sonorae]